MGEPWTDGVQVGPGAHSRSRSRAAQLVRMAEECELVDRDELVAQITDLITDLLHLAHCSGLSAGSVLAAAQRHFEAEIEERST